MGFNSLFTRWASVKGAWQHQRRRDSHAFILLILPILLSCLISVSPAVVRAEDVVRLSTANGSRTVRGEILDYTGDAITIAGPNGRALRYPASNVVYFETVWTDAHQVALTALAHHDYQTAAGQLAEANRAERRVWARRRILIDLMRCYEATHHLEQAGELFLAIVQSDPTTSAYDAAPLAWYATSAVGQAKAEAWLARDDEPAAALLGASYLQSTSSASVARAALAQLISHADARVAALAEAQTWRGEAMRASAADVARWAGRVEQMPAGVRAGPYFVLGQALSRLTMADEASLAYLRVPALYAGRRELAARSLMAAARLARGADRRDEMVLMCNEVVADFSDTRLAVEARDLLQEVGPADL